MCSSYWKKLLNRNQKSKISWHCPFKGMLQFWPFKSLHSCIFDYLLFIMLWSMNFVKALDIVYLTVEEEDSMLSSLPLVYSLRQRQTWRNFFLHVLFFDFVIFFHESFSFGPLNSSISVMFYIFFICGCISNKGYENIIFNHLPCLPPVSLTPVVQLELGISFSFLEKNRIGANRIRTDVDDS